MADDLSNEEHESQERSAKREAEFEAAFFDEHYPSIIDAIKRVVSQAAGDHLQMREGVYDKMIFRIGEDLADFQFSEAMQLAGAKPFDPWAVPTKAFQAEEAIFALKAFNAAYVAGMKAGRE